MSSGIKLRFAFLLLTGLHCVSRGAPGAEATRLTEAAAVLSLSAEKAGLRIPVTVTGVVTAAELDWEGQFFVQDESGGVFVESFQRCPPAPGDVVRVEGVTHPGAFAPIISSPQWWKLGTAPLPEPRRALIENLVNGTEDSQRVEISGIVRTTRIADSRLVMDLAVGGDRLQVQARQIPGVPLESLIAARVRVRGTAATHYLSVLRHLTAVAVYAPRVEDFTIIEREEKNPFDDEIVPVINVAQYHRGRRAEQRVHVRGVVTYQDTQGEVYLQDASGGIRTVAAAHPATPFTVGEMVDAAGFIEYEGFLPLLRDATLRFAGGTRAPVTPRPVAFAEISRGEHNGELVTVRGHILDYSTRSDTRSDGSQAGVISNWLVQGEELTFTVEYASTAVDAGLAAIQRGSLIEVDGLCASTVDITGKLISTRFLISAPTSLRVLQHPSWFTATRLLAGLGIVSVVLILAVAWVLTVERKNVVLRRVVRELERAQKELQEAHDTLEQKVSERSAQLQIEMTIRKTAELQFKAVLAERTRLARDLHDTLQQTLAGIALRLNASAKLSRRDPDSSDAHLLLARNWLHQSQVDLHRSIWDLRSRELEQFDLAGALRRSAEHMRQGTEIVLDFQSEGQPDRLPEVVEENVLRIGQEALTNIGKHAKATHVTIRLHFGLNVLRLRITDNGVGFPQDSIPDEGHFGLVGMTERAKRMSGTVVVRSAPGQGSTIELEILIARGDVSVHSDTTVEPEITI